MNRCHTLRLQSSKLPPLCVHTMTACILFNTSTHSNFDTDAIYCMPVCVLFHICAHILTVGLYLLTKMKTYRSVMNEGQSFHFFRRGWMPCCRVFQLLLYFAFTFHLFFSGLSSSISSRHNLILVLFIISAI